MILITAPTSRIGRQVLRLLVDSTEDLRVIARDVSRIEPGLRNRISVMEGSHGDGALVGRAAEGVEAVFWLVPPNPQAATADEAYSGFSAPGLAALRARGVKRMVGISALGRGTPQADQAGLVTATLALDDLVAGSGMAYRAVTNPAFFDNLLHQAQSIREQGVFYSAVDPSRRMPHCATEDIAATSVRLLLDDRWKWAGHEAVLGAEDLSFDDMASVMTVVFGKPVKCVRTDYATYRQQFVRRGWSEAMAQGMTDMMRAKSEGLDNGEVRTSRNTTPTRFRQWCETVLKPAVTG